MRTTAILLSLLTWLAAAAWSAAAPPRPLAGIGILTIRLHETGQQEATPVMPLFREPGVERVASRTLPELPHILHVTKPSDEKYGIAVIRKSGDWVRVVYDDSGREGWFDSNRRGWEFLPWDRFLPGTDVRLLAGLKKDFYRLQQAPSTAAGTTTALTGEMRLRVIETKGPWMLVLVDFATPGWLRWQDDDGRFLISLNKIH